MGADTQDEFSNQLAEVRRRWSCSRCWLCSACVAAILLLAAAGFFFDQTHGDQPDYSIAINSVSGLDPAMDLGRRPTLDPEFNMTLGVASDKLWASECAESGMYLEVSYRGVSLAASVTTTENICAGPQKEVDRSVIARGTGVVVPGSVLDSLAGDMRRGAQVFDVALRGLRTYSDISCLPRRVGDAISPC